MTQKDPHHVIGVMKKPPPLKIDFDYAMPTADADALCRDIVRERLAKVTIEVAMHGTVRTKYLLL